MSKPLKPSIKNLALKRIGKAEKLVKMLARVRGLNNDAALSSLDAMKQQVHELAGGRGKQRVESDLL